MVNTVVAGSPLLPTSFLLKLLLVFLAALAVMALAVANKFSYLSPAGRLKKLFEVGLLTLIFLGVASVSLAAYWLLPTPGLVRSSILGKDEVSLQEPLVFQFDRPVSRQKLEKVLTPEVPGTWVFEQPLYGTHLTRRLVFYPQVSLTPDTEYKVNFSGITNTSGFSRSLSQNYTFHTKKSAQLASVSVAEGELGRSRTKPIQVNLTEVNEGEVEFSFSLEPETQLEVALNPDKRSYTLSFPEPLQKKMAYLLAINRSSIAKNLETGEIISREIPKVIKYVHFATEGELTPEETFSREHPMYGAVHVIDASPKNKASGVKQSGPISLTFSQAVNHSSAEAAFSISPAAEGTFEWAANIMSFRPKQLTANTAYTVSLSPGIRGVVGKPSTENYVLTFTTAAPAVKLGVPAYLQQHALSCEVSSLRMALAYRGVTASENQLLDALGVDNTSHVGSIWGDPYEKFVGNVNGRQMVDGYGVYWGPIARIAGNYRRAEAFENWNLPKLTAQILQGNPVLVWVFSNKGISTSWYTPSGKQVYAVRDEHSVVVVGFTGNPENPSQIIVNDPLVGQVYWTRDWFEKKWGIFSRSGVVIY